MKMPAALDESISCYFTLARPLAKLKRLLTTIQQTANNVNPQVSESVQLLILHLVNNIITPEQFQSEVQKIINCPLKQFVVPFLSSTIPLLQEEIQRCQNTNQRLPDIAERPENSQADSGSKRPAPHSPNTLSPFKRPCYPDNKQSVPPTTNRKGRVIKRALLISQCLRMLGQEMEEELLSLQEEKGEEKEERQFTKEMDVLTAVLSTISGKQSEVIMSQVKGLLQAASDESEERVQTELNRQDDDQTKSCWNCGRKALESCSRCAVAKYCGQFCQHKHWEVHHKSCKSAATEVNISVTD